MSETVDVAVIGAGVAGLACARRLAAASRSVVVFEKSRGLGGRCATRRTEAGVAFDHGAQYFTARDSAFCDEVGAWAAAGVVARWEGRIVSLAPGAPPIPTEPTERWVGTPGMNALGKRLAAGLDVRTGVRIARVERTGDRWRLFDDAGTARAEATTLLATAPAGQTAELLADVAPTIALPAAQTAMQPCWAAMAVFPERLSLDYDGAFVVGSPLRWIARNSSKPGRAAEPEAWVLHADGPWTAEHWESPSDAVAAELLAAFHEATGVAVRPVEASAHRWKFALPTPLSERSLFDASRRVGAAGDWCGGPRVEGAWLSGCELAARASV